MHNELTLDFSLTAVGGRGDGRAVGLVHVQGRWPGLVPAKVIVATLVDVTLHVEMFDGQSQS